MLHAWINLAVKELSKVLDYDFKDPIYNYDEAYNILTLESEDYYIFKNKNIATKFAISEIETRIKTGLLKLDEKYVSKFIKFDPKVINEFAKFEAKKLWHYASPKQILTEYSKITKVSKDESYVDECQSELIKLYEADILKQLKTNPRQYFKNKSFEELVETKYVIFETNKIANDYINIHGVECIAIDKVEILLPSKIVVYKI